MSYQSGEGEEDLFDVEGAGRADLGGGIEEGMPNAGGGGPTLEQGGEKEREWIGGIFFIIYFCKAAQLISDVSETVIIRISDGIFVEHKSVELIIFPI